MIRFQRLPDSMFNSCSGACKGRPENCTTPFWCDAPVEPQPKPSKAKFCLHYLVALIEFRDHNTAVRCAELQARPRLNQP